MNLLSSPQAQEANFEFGQFQKDVVYSCVCETGQKDTEATSRKNSHLMSGKEKEKELLVHLQESTIPGLTRWKTGGVLEGANNKHVWHMICVSLPGQMCQLAIVSSPGRSHEQQAHNAAANSKSQEPGWALTRNCTLKIPTVRTSHAAHSHNTVLHGNLATTDSVEWADLKIAAAACSPAWWQLEAG